MTRDTTVHCTRMSLNGAWSLRYRRKQNRGKPRRPGPATDLPARVPGDVHLDLMRAGRIKDPLRSDNAPACAWIGRQEWWYQRTFEYEPGPGCHELVFDGLCYVADVWLNGTHIGHHENMHRPLRLDVTRHLKRRNKLEVRLLAFSDKALDTPDIHASAGYPAVGKDYGHKKFAMRKAAYSFGWNWTQGLPLCGIWRDVRLESTPVARTEDVFVRSFPDGRVRVTGTCRASGKQAREARLRIDVREYESGKHVVSTEQPVTLASGTTSFDSRLFIRSPKLWWPVGLGRPFLYKAVVSLESGGTRLSRETVRFGIREVEIREPRISDDRAGFTFAVNGVPVFIRGANWIPPDIIPPRATAQRYKMLLEQAVECGMNYLRFWGGGIYEGDTFYRLCDENGIMLWHDMMFGNGELPDFDTDFVDETRREFEWAVKHLRNHPSIIMWCGSNETDQCCQQYKSMRPHGLYHGEHLLHDLFPEWLAPLDDTREYRPSSGCLGKHSPPGDSYLNFRHGVCHEYYQDPFNTDEELDEKTPAFVNEWYGGSPPLPGSLRKFLKTSERRWDSPAFALHDFSDFLTARGMGPVIARHLTYHDMQDLAAIPFEDLCELLQEWHAEYMTRSIEHYRRRKWICSGYSYWMFDSAYTSIDKSLTDYYATPKPAFFAVKRVNRPLLPIVALYQDRLEAHISNESLSWYQGTLELAVRTFTGRTVHKQKAHVDVAPNSTEQVLSVTWEQAGQPDRAATFAQLTFRSDDGQTSVCNHRFFDKIKRLKLPAARVSIKPVGGKGDTFALHAPTLARRVSIFPSDSRTRPDDNFLDLMPGETRKVRFSRPVAAKDVTVQWANDARAGLVLSRFAPEELRLTPGTPLSISCEFFNPGSRRMQQPVTCLMPDGITADYPRTVSVAPGRAAAFTIALQADPATVVPGNRKATFALGPFDFVQELLVERGPTVSPDGVLTFHNGTGRTLTLEGLTLEWDEKDGKHRRLDLGTLAVPPGNFRRKLLEPNARIVPFSARLRNGDLNLGDQWIGDADGTRLWKGLPVKLFRTGDLTMFATANSDWPNLGAEGHGYRVRPGVDPAVSYKGTDDMQALLFLHHNATTAFIDLLVKGIEYQASESERSLQRGTSLELGLSTTTEQMDFEAVFALTRRGPASHVRLTNGERPQDARRTEGVRLKMFHLPASRMLTYHIAVPWQAIAPVPAEELRVSMVINEREDSQVKIFDGIQGGKSAGRFGVARLARA